VIVRLRRDFDRQSDPEEAAKMGKIIVAQERALDKLWKSRYGSERKGRY